MSKEEEFVCGWTVTASPYDADSVVLARDEGYATICFDDNPMTADELLALSELLAREAKKLKERAG